MATITERLASLAMSEDAQRFADNRIAAVSILRDLTEQDLKDIGVPVGHRRKMLRAIAEVGAAPTQMQSAAAPEPGERALMSPEPNAARTEAYFERALAVARAQQAKSLD